MAASLGPKDRWLVGALLAFALVPALGGALRLRDLGGGVVTADGARFLADPVPAAFHIVAASLFAFLAPFQFVPRLRSGPSGWHRRSGRLLAPLGLGVALSGLWMNATYVMPVVDGLSVYLFRWAAGLWMVTCIVLALVAVRRRAFQVHGAWMVRAYAVGMGAGTQVLTHLPIFVLAGEMTELLRGLAMGAGWGINVLVAEVILARRSRASQRSPLGSKIEVAAVSSGSPARLAG